MARSRYSQTFVESGITFSEHNVAGLSVGVHKPELTPWPLFFARGVAVFTEARRLPPPNTTYMYITT